MSDDLTEAPFKAASKKVQDAHEQAEQDLMAKVEKAKSSALKKLPQ